jgi:hypothetical protein
VAEITPVLLLGYNRPEQMRGLIQSLSPFQPKVILLAIDGPNQNRPNDPELVKQTQEAINQVAWNAEIITRYRESNLGLRRAVVDAVTWANSEYGRVIVLEDDVRAGPQLLDFLNHNLDKYEKQNEVAHINGYNLVPIDHINKPDEASRISIYPESYAWATWDRAWKNYDDDLTWAKSASIDEIKKIVGSTTGALRWRQNFNDAAAERIDTWAYRWLASMWAKNLKIISPNQNIAQYFGSENGTHTRRKIKWQELEIESLPTNDRSLGENKVDKLADGWLKKSVFKETIMGVLEGQVISILLSIIKKVNSK